MAFYTAPQLAILTAGTVRHAWLARMDFKSETVRRWAGHRTITAFAEEWLPTYGAVTIEGLGSSFDTTSKQFTLTLSGVDPDLMALALAETHEADQQPILIYEQLFDADWQRVGDPVWIAYGLMQQPRASTTAATQESGSVQSLVLPCENPFYNRSRVPNGRYTPRDQNNRTTPEDKICDYVSHMRFKTFVWPDF